MRAISLSDGGRIVAADVGLPGESGWPGGPTLVSSTKPKTTCTASTSTIDRLFGAFYTTKADAMGIGLSIRHSIVEAHEGRIWASRDFGQGATFQFTVPLPGA